MLLHKVTVFDKIGVAEVEVDEEGQAKPSILGVRWVNPETLETISVRGGKRTGPKGEILQEVKPTVDMGPFAMGGRGEAAGKAEA